MEALVAVGGGGKKGSRGSDDEGSDTVPSKKGRRGEDSKEKEKDKEKQSGTESGSTGASQQDEERLGQRQELQGEQQVSRGGGPAVGQNHLFFIPNEQGLGGHQVGCVLLS